MASLARSAFIAHPKLPRGQSRFNRIALGLDSHVGQTRLLIQIIDFRKKGGEHAPIYINGAEVERGNSIKFLRVTITNNLSWISNGDATVKKAQQHLFFLRQLRKFDVSIKTLTNFYRCTIESILSGCITAW
eukprot:g15166.t1